MAGKPVAKPVAMYRKRTRTVETGSRREVRYRGPAAETRPTADVCAAEMRTPAAETRPATDVRAAEVGCATAEMRRSAHMHAAAELATATAADMRAATTAVKSASTSAASSRPRVSGARESGHQSNGGKALDSLDFGF
jgi:hypothetical protein